MRIFILYCCMNLLAAAAACQLHTVYAPHLPELSRLPDRPVLNTVSLDGYLKKRKRQKKTAFIFLGSGAGLMIASFIIPRGAYTGTDLGITPFGAYIGDSYKNDGLRAAFFVAGAAGSLASIPFFVASRKSRKRATAARVVLKMEREMAGANLAMPHGMPAAGVLVVLR